LDFTLHSNHIDKGSIVAANKTSRSKYKRVLLKLSGEVLRNKKTGASIDPAAIAQLARRIKGLLAMKAQIAIVIGGGNIIRGATEGSGIDRLTGDHMGMLGTTINALAIKSALKQVGVEARVQCAVKIDRLAEPVIIEKADAHLNGGRVVIFAGGTGNPFFTTDTAAALRASELDADVILKATKVDGVYSADPMKNKNAKLYKKISYAEALKKRLAIMDASAFAMCMDNGIPIIVFNFFKPGSIKKVLAGQACGTLVS
jgi:uridylate kinase